MTQNEKTVAELFDQANRHTKANEALNKGGDLASKLLVQALTSMDRKATVQEVAAMLYQVSTLFGDCVCVATSVPGAMIDGSDGFKLTREMLRRHFEADLTNTQKAKLHIGLRLASKATGLKP